MELLEAPQGYPLGGIGLRELECITSSSAQRVHQGGPTWLRGSLTTQEPSHAVHSIRAPSMPRCSGDSRLRVDLRTIIVLK